MWSSLGYFVTQEERLQGICRVGRAPWPGGLRSGLARVGVFLWAGSGVRPLD